MTELHQKIIDLANPEMTASQIAKIVKCDRSVVYFCIQKYDLKVKRRKSHEKKDSLKKKILEMYSTDMTSSQLAEILGCSEKYVQNTLNSHNVERLSRGARNGELNPAWRFGRMIDHDGYATIPAPLDHPYKRACGRIAEHRYVLELHLGRYLKPFEVVDHIDGLHLHNDPSNLRVFQSNADHLRATIFGKTPNWSLAGIQKQYLPYRQRVSSPRIHTYRLRKASGDVRLQQILLAALKLGIDSPFLLGTHHLLEQAQIDYSDATKIKQALDDLFP